MIYEHIWICTVYRSSSFALANLEIKTNFFHRILNLGNGKLAKVRYTFVLVFAGNLLASTN